VTTWIDEFEINSMDSWPIGFVYEKSANLRSITLHIMLASQRDLEIGVPGDRSRGLQG
jgi:hypothetical protein